MKGLLITQMGYVYRISKKNWRRLCRAASKAGPYGVDVGDYGAVPFGPIHENITDWAPEDYTEELERGA